MLPEMCPVCYNENVVTKRAAGFFTIKERVFELPFPKWYHECVDCTFRWESSTSLEHTDKVKQSILQSVDTEGEVDFY